MKIPETIRIGGVEYPIVEVSGLNDGNLMCYGMIDYESCEIYLNAERGTAHEKRCLILLHEVMHGIVRHMGAELDPEQEEYLVDMFARGVYQVLQDNETRLFDINPQPKKKKGGKK